MNCTRGKRERIGRILRMHANKREELQRVLRRQHLRRRRPRATRRTGDTLCDEKAPIVLETHGLPGAGDLDRRSSQAPRPTSTSWASACRSSRTEDPSFRTFTNEETGQTIIAGMGELHLEIIVDRLKREFKVEANVGKPEVAYREAHREEGRGRGQVHPPVAAATASTAT